MITLLHSFEGFCQTCRSFLKYSNRKKWDDNKFEDAEIFIECLVLLSVQTKGTWRKNKFIDHIRRIIRKF